MTVGILTRDRKCVNLDWRGRRKILEKLSEEKVLSEFIAQKLHLK